jgi:hypothetical protein
MKIAGAVDIYVRQRSKSSILLVTGSNLLVTDQKRAYFSHFLADSLYSFTSNHAVKLVIMNKLTNYIITSSLNSAKESALHAPCRCFVGL